MEFQSLPLDEAVLKTIQYDWENNHNEISGKLPSKDRLESKLAFQP
jgi:hypothetical protein